MINGAAFLFLQLARGTPIVAKIPQPFGLPQK